MMQPYKHVRAATLSGSEASQKHFCLHAELMFEMQIDQALEDDSVVFRDDSSVKADVIMHCTE
jgi:hypothetical protein